MSLGASGSVAKTIVFSHWKGRPYVRQHVTPANPRSAAQIGGRSMMSFLSKAWAHYLAGASKQASWAALAKATTISEFNAFTQLNRKNWTQFLAPIATPTDARSGTLPTLAAPTVTAGVGEISWSQVITTIAGGWGIALFFSKTPAFTPAISDLHQVITIDGHANGDTVTATLLRMGHAVNWYYSFAAFTTDGKLAARSATAGPVLTI
jgi:hypothetical protein